MLHMKQVVEAVLTDKLGMAHMVLLGNHKPSVLTVLQTHILYHKQCSTHILSMSTSVLDTSPPLSTSVCSCSVSYSPIYHCCVSSISFIPLPYCIVSIHFLSLSWCVCALSAGLYYITAWSISYTSIYYGVCALSAALHHTLIYLCSTVYLDASMCLYYTRYTLIHDSMSVFLQMF